jgi:hypothetical protein
MADIHDEEREAIHWMEELAQLLGSGQWPGLREWQVLCNQAPPAVNGNHIWRP